MRRVAVALCALAAWSQGVAAEDLRTLFDKMRASMENEHPLTAAEVEEQFDHFARHWTEEAGKLQGLQESVAEREARARVAVAESRPAVTAHLVASVQGSTWEAEQSAHFQGWSLRDFKKLLGSKVGKDKTHHLPHLKHVAPEKFEQLKATAVPDQFDSREHFKQCPTIGHIRDQASCGSCWAFATTEAFNDRLCIATNGKFTTLLSPTDTASCCSGMACMGSQGCNGGQPSEAWQFFSQYGIVTGGDYNDQTTCWPYTLEPCEHHVPGSRPNCNKLPDGHMTCPATKACTVKSYPKAFDADVHKSATAYSLTADEVKQDILTYGPVSAAFTVYSDFPAYKSGVYEHKTGSELGGHAVKIIGWGTESGMDYWLIANSWNSDWGMGGVFKIKQGDCGINDDLNGGHATSSEDIVV